MRLQTLSVLAAASLTAAQTPPGFQPAVQAQLLVQYGNVQASNGAVLPRDATQVQPQLSTSQRLTGQYAVVMVDLDIPTDAPPRTNTLLHWLQTGLESAQTGTPVNGSGQVFLLQNRANTAALAPYIGPNPPNRVPLSHRYTFVLVDHSRITAQGLTALRTAAGTRLGFNAAQVLTAAGLGQNAVAGSFFNVTNSGAAPNGTVSPPGGAGVGGGGGGSPTIPAPSGTLSPRPGSSSTVPGVGVALDPRAGIMSACLLAVGAVFLGL